MKTRLTRSRPTRTAWRSRTAIDLAGDLARGEVALQAEFGGEAELAVDGAADLRGDADGGAGPAFRVLFASVAGFAAVAFGHPDCLHGVSFHICTFKFNEIALSAVGGLEGSGDRRAADPPAFVSQLRRSCIGNVVISESLRNILKYMASEICFATKGWFAQPNQYVRKCSGIQSK